jgi:hypothetical protein
MNCTQQRMLYKLNCYTVLDCTSIRSELCIVIQLAVSMIDKYDRTGSATDANLAHARQRKVLALRRLCLSSSVNNSTAMQLLRNTTAPKL